MAEVIEHITRTSLPWRSEDDALTECGLAANSVKVSLSLEQMQAKIKEQGQARAAMTSCMTCWQTTNRHRPKGTADPILHVIERSLERRGWTNDTPEALRLGKEFRAMVMLVERHRDEFDQLVQDMEGAVNLTEFRREKMRRER